MSTHRTSPELEDRPEEGRDAELSWMAAVAATLLVVIIAILAAAA